MSDTPPNLPRHYDWQPRHLAVLLIANAGLALGPLLVRLSDTGPVATGFWRLAIAFPVILMLGLREGRGERTVKGMALLAVLAAGLAFGLDIATWHIGIGQTKLGNASFFGNGGSVILMAWGLIAARRRPRPMELAAITASLCGAALLMSGSLEIGHANLVGDLFCLLAGVLYAIYILLLGALRGRIGNYSLLWHSMLASVPLLFAIAWFQGEAIVPQAWWPILALALTSQLIGQGGLIYALKHFPPLVIGLALLTQPAVAAFTGWAFFGEGLSFGDVVGMMLLAAALVLAKAGGK